MKTFKFLFLTLAVTLSALISSSAQNYKAPAIDASGKVTDAMGKHIG